MTLGRAERIILNKYPTEQPISVVDWDKYYVFNSVPKDTDKNADGRILKPLRAVLKDTGKVIVFNPLHHGGPGYAKAVKENIKYYV